MGRERERDGRKGRVTMRERKGETHESEYDREWELGRKTAK